MKRLLPISLLLLLSPLALPRPAAAQTILIDRIVARVNDRMATLSDFERQYGDRRQALLADGSVDEARKQEALSRLGRSTFAEMYEELLLLSRADQLNARITDADVSKQLAQTRERMGIQTDEQFQQALKASGLTEDGLKDRMRRNLLVQEVMGREVQPRLKIDEDELRRYYREHPEEFTEAEGVKLQDVVVLDDGKDADAVAATARSVRDALKGNADAEEVSKGTGGKTQYVDLGWIVAGDLDADIEKAVWPLSAGSVTEPVHGRGGLHVLRVQERRPPKMHAFDEVKQAIQGKIEQQRMGAEYRKYLRELEQRSYIALTVPPEAEGFKGLTEFGQEESPFGDELGDVPPPAAAAPAPANAPGAAPATTPDGRPAPAPAATPPPAPKPTPPPPSR